MGSFMTGPEHDEWEKSSQIKAPLNISAAPIFKF
jgi:hypothetical protein